MPDRKRQAVRRKVETAPIPLQDSRWLFKRDNDVFGPVPSKEILQKLYEGAFDGESLIAPEDGEFRPLRTFSAFRQHLPKVEEHQAAVADVHRKEKTIRATIIRKRFKWVGTASVVGVLVFVATIYAIRSYRAEQVAAQEESRLRAELDNLLASVTIEPPLAELPAEPTRKSGAKPGKKPSGKRRRAVARFSGGRARGTGTLTYGEIMSGVASVFGGLKTCIARQMQRDRDSVPEEIVLSFSISNAGMVKEPTLEDRVLRRTPLHGCVSGQLLQIRYRSYKGEVRNVHYPITISRR